jgi:CelD/BcsL family acetyltransferase involved in cellulose biosynthesis
MTRSITNAKGLQWIQEEIRLWFRLGQYRFYPARLQALIHRDWTELTPESAATLRLDFKDVPPEIDGLVIRSQPVLSRPPRRAKSADAIIYTPDTYRHYYADITRSFEEYLSHFSSKSRATLRRKVKNFEQECGGRLDLREYRTPAELTQFHSIALRLASQTYQARLLHAALPDTPRFKQEMADLGARGAVYAFLLMKGDVPAAYAFCPISNGAVIYRYVGYAPEFADLSAGTVLQYLIFQRLCGQVDLTIFDFTEGEGEQKRFFSTGSMLCADVYYLRKTARHSAIVLGHCACESISGGVGRTLERFGLKARFQRWLRRGSSVPRQGPGLAG